MTTKQAQCLLSYLGYYADDVDGEWNTLLEIAINAFQKDFGIDINGIIDRKTAKALIHAVTYGIPIREDR